MRPAPRPLPSAEILNELLSYDPETGGLVWRNDGPKGRKAGTPAGSVCKQWGYRQVFVAGRNYLAHRLIWKMHHGTDPAEHIDHINGCRDDGRITNLREATHAQNMCNRKRTSLNTSGVVGVHWNKCAKKWKAQIGVNRRIINLGLHSTIEAAAAAYQKAKQQYHGEFSPKTPGPVAAE